MTSRKLYIVAKKIQLKLAQSADTVIEGTPPSSQDETALFIYKKPADWSTAKMLDFQRSMNAWGKARGYKGNLLKEDGVWGQRTTEITRGFWGNTDIPNSAKQNPEAMYQYMKAQELESKLPKAGFMTDKKQNPVSPEFISEVQNKLKEMNYYAGPVDGRWNVDGMTALTKLQKDVGSNKTDGLSLDEATQTRLGL